MPKDEGEAAWRNFDAARRERITKLMRSWLLAQKRGPDEAGALVGKLERWAAYHSRRPGERRSDTELFAKFPLGVSTKARALRRSLDDQHTYEKKTPESLIYAAQRWRITFEPDEWQTFYFILATLADGARQNRRPQDERLRSLEAKVLTLFENAGLPARASQYAADILVQLKEHALGTPIPRTRDARLKALRDAVHRRADSAP